MSKSLLKDLTTLNLGDVVEVGVIVSFILSIIIWMPYFVRG